MMGPTAGRPIPDLTEEDQRRFWAKVQLTDERGCMVWTASKVRGYGRFNLGGSRYQAHRISWTLANGPIPPGLVLDHLCRNRACVNPLHLEVVTNRENTMRGEVPRIAGQWQREKTHCPAGHTYSAENTYVSPPDKSHPNGRRHCRACQRERDRAYRLRKRLAAGASDN